MTIDDGSILLPSGVGKTVSLQGNQLTFVHRDPADAYSLIDWITPPGLPSPPLHIHRVTDEAFYVLEGTFGFQAGEETIEGSAGAFVLIPRGRKHTFWNQGSVPARVLIVLSPSGFERYFEELAEGLAVVGDMPEKAMSLRKALSQRYDIEVVGPPIQAHENPL
jgi:quercetin dioxygenase-like cupin family protein